MMKIIKARPTASLFYGQVTYNSQIKYSLDCHCHLDSPKLFSRWITQTIESRIAILVDAES